VKDVNSEEMLEDPLLLIRHTIHYFSPLSALRPAMAVSAPARKLPINKIDLHSERLGPLFEQFSGYGKLLAPARLSSDRSFDKGYSQNGILFEVAII
jgi:hypothetical protein